VKMNGNNPRKLLNKISEKIDTKMKVLPFLLLKRFLNSLCNLERSKFHIVKWRDGISHILVGINSNPKSVLVQLRGKLTLVDGSNTENSFLIIFS
jgi:hypothetical protein